MELSARWLRATPKSPSQFVYAFCRESAKATIGATGTVLWRVRIPADNPSVLRSAGPHPNPLPEGEGDIKSLRYDPAPSPLRERVGVRVTVRFGTPGRITRPSSLNQTRSELPAGASLPLSTMIDQQFRGCMPEWTLRTRPDDTLPHDCTPPSGRQRRLSSPR